MISEQIDIIKDRSCAVSLRCWKLLTKTKKNKDRVLSESKLLILLSLDNRIWTVGYYFGVVHHSGCPNLMFAQFVNNYWPNFNKTLWEFSIPKGDMHIHCMLQLGSFNTELYPLYVYRVPCYIQLRRFNCVICILCPRYQFNKVAFYDCNDATSWLEVYLVNLGVI